MKSRGRSARAAAVLAAALALLAGPAPAQTINASLRGKVADEQGAALSGAAVTARNVETNVSRSVVTGALGQYFLPNLPAGTYEVTAELDRFSPSRRSGLALRVGQDVSVDFTLKLGGLQEAVDVVETAYVLETTQNTVGTIINREQIDDLPTIQRDFQDLARLSPGVTTGTGGNGQTISVNGQPGYTNGIFVDGASNEWNYYGIGASSFAQDWIQEFQVMTNSYAAEFGTASGGILNVITRSGTNAFHGRAYGFFRDDSLDAAPYAGFFDGGRPQFLDGPPPLSQQRFGGFLSGPLVKDRLFFFAGLERLDRDSNDVLGISQYWRDQGIPTLVPTGTDDTPYLFKVDANLSAKNRLSIRYDHSERTDLNQGGPLAVEEARQNFGGPVWNVVANWTSTFSNTAFNEFRFFYGSNKPPIICNESGTGGTEQLGLGPPGTFARRQYPGAVFGCPIFTGLEGEENLAIIENYSFVRGRHQFKLGAQAAWQKTILDITNFHDGRWIHATDRVFSRSDPVSWPERFTGNVGAVPADPTTWSTYFFVQDTWQVTDSLTLNLGLRYDVDGSVAAGNEFIDGKNQRILAALGGAPVLEKVEKDTDNFAPRVGVVWKPTADRRTTLRANGGLFYDQHHTNYNGIYLANSLLNDGIIGLNANNPAFNPFYDPADPEGSRQRLREFFALTYPLFPDLSGAPRSAQTLNIIRPDIKIPYTVQLTGGVAHDFGGGLSLEADYIHSRGEDGFIFINENIRFQNGEYVFNVDPRFAGLDYLHNDGWSRYNALQVQGNYRRGRGRVGVAYTLGKATSNYSPNIFGAGPTNPFDLSEDEGPDDSDRRHNLVLNGAFTLPLDFQLAGIWIFRSAPPYNVFTFDELDGDPWSDRPEPRNSRRGDSFNSLDLRLSKILRAGK
ncbi:MAG TPA: TonB-dependent receptor, partial [Vicinamibacteria bacterium]|nr:TonB-dependent receptor [Vicinamibacteria bacterium]